MLEIHCFQFGLLIFFSQAAKDNDEQQPTAIVTSNYKILQMSINAYSLW